MLDYRYDKYLQIGLSHEDRGIPCQDYVGTRRTDRYLVAALADGIGSLANSQDAAQVAVDTFLDWATENGNRLFAAGNKEIQQIVGSEFFLKVREWILAQDAKGQMDCNFAFVIIDCRESQYILGQLGDCAACTVCDNGNSYVMTEFSGSANGTNSIMNADAAAGLQVWLLHCADAKGVILTSDGLDGYVYRKNSNLLRKESELVFNSILNQTSQESIRELINEAVEMSPAQFNDDISIAVISWAERLIELPENPYWLCSCGQKNDLADGYCGSCGEDFLKLYENQDYDAKGGFDQFFLYYNANPLAMEALVGIESFKSVPTAKKSEDHCTLPEPDIDDIDALISRRIDQNVRKTKHTGGQFPDQKQQTAQESTAADDRSKAAVAPKNGTETAALAQNSPTREDHVDAIAGDGTPENGTTNRERHEQDREKRKNEQKRKALLEWMLLIFAAFAVVSMILRPLFSSEPKPDKDPTGESMSVSSQDDHKPPQTWPGETFYKDTVPQETPPPETEPEPTEPADSGDDVYLILDHDVLYYGEHEDGLPHGEGILLLDGYYYIGCFDEGTLKGTFQIIKIGSYKKSETKKYASKSVEELIGEFYEDEEPVTTAPVQTEPDEETNVRYFTQNVTKLRKEPDFAAERHPVDIKKGTKVWLTGKKTELLVQIRLEDGTTWWCSPEQLQTDPVK